MKIIVHCGMSKTGTTSLQSFLFKNSVHLMNSRILYPVLNLSNEGGAESHSAKTHHSELILSCLDDDEYIGSLGRSNEEKIRQGTIMSEKLWERLKVDVCNNNPDILLISSEYICGMRPGSVKKFIDKLRKISINIHLVVYIRDPVSHYLSSMQQVIKYGSTIRSPYVPYKYTQMFKKIKNQEVYECYIGKYSSEKLIKGSVIRDFIKRFISEWDINKLVMPSKNENTGLSAESMYILEKFNREIWNGRRIPGNPVNVSLIRALQKEEHSSGCFPAQLRPNIKGIIMDTNAADLQRLRESYRFELFSDEIQPTDKKSEGIDKITWGVSDIIDVDVEKAERLLIRSVAGLSKMASKILD